ncbi:MAG TPA: hypothetical protein VNC16_04535 [Solirubrobacterales bacterium]|jgi:hypothetical protein|nr:hypothetical protein [Solirubrobacterales bacterium]
MLRTSDISATSEFELEHMREDLRDRRSSRYRRNLQTTAVALSQTLGILLSAAGLAHFFGWL